MAATTRARGETSGRMKRDSPSAPSGMQPRRRTFCTRPIDPKKTVPDEPDDPEGRRGRSGGPHSGRLPPGEEVVPAGRPARAAGPAGPTVGRDPKKSSLVPMTTTRAAMQHGDDALRGRC